MIILSPLCILAVSAVWSQHRFIISFIPIMSCNGNDKHVAEDAHLALSRTDWRRIMLENKVEVKLEMRKHVNIALSFVLVPIFKGSRTRIKRVRVHAGVR